MKQEVWMKHVFFAPKNVLDIIGFVLENEKTVIFTSFWMPVITWSIRKIEKTDDVKFLYSCIFGPKNIPPFLKNSITSLLLSH